jgi:hypothetical protein
MAIGTLRPALLFLAGPGPEVLSAARRSLRLR